MEKKNHGLKITLVVLMCAIIVIGCAGLIFGALIKKPHEIFISFKDTNGAIFKEEKLDEKEVKKENSTSENAVLDYAPTKDGYVFKGWFVDTELTHQFDKNDLVVGSLILYAKWEKQSFTVTFYDIDKQIILVNGQQNQVVFYDESAVAPETQALTHEGMTFSGWDNSFNNVKGDISITAVYKKNTYNLSFFSLGKSVASYPLDYQDSLTTYANTATEALAEALAIPAGKQFDCWCSDEALTQKVDLNTIIMPSSDMKLYAKFVFAPIENISLNAYCNNTLFADTINQFSNTLVFNGNDIILKTNFSPIDGVNYAFNWYKIDNNIETLVKTTSTANETALSINLGVLSTGNYSYKFEVIAQENGYDSVANTATINFSLTAKGAPTITTPNTTFNYTGKNIAFSKNGADKSKLNFIGAEETDTIEFKSDLNGAYQSVFPTMKNAGSYDLYYRVNRANSASFEGNCTIKIDKIVLTLTPENISVKYGDEMPSFNFTCAGLVAGETADVITTVVTYSCNYIKTTPLNATGETTYPIMINGEPKAENYVITCNEGTLTVIKKQLTITAEAKTITYGASAPTYTAKYDGFVNGDTEANLDKKLTFACDYDVNNSANNGVKTYIITPGGFTSTNYDLSFVNANLTVNAKQITNLTLDITGNYTYNGTEQTPTYTLKNNAILLTINTDFTATLSNNKNAGTATLTLAGTGNYSGSIVQTFTIAKATLTITANAETITYGDPAPNYTATFSGFVNGENENTTNVLSENLIITCAYDVNNSATNGAQTYTITPGGLTSTNYDLSFVSANLTVNPKQINNLALDITGNYTYNGLEQTPTYKLTKNDINKTELVAGTDFTAQLSNNKNAGTATLTLTGKGNYSGSIEKTFTIATAPLTITANAETITYGDSAPKYTAKYVGFVNGENENTTNVLGGNLVITCAYNVNDSANNGAKTYTITPSGLTSANYTLEFVNGELVVKPQVITKETFTLTLTPTISKPIGASAFAKNLALATQNINSGEYIYTGLAQIPSYKLTKNDNKTELVEGKDFNFNISDNINVGSAKITIEGKGNYSGSIGKTFTIAKAPLKVTANTPTAITYGDLAPNYTAKYDGFVNGENENKPNVLSENLIITCAYDVNNSATNGAKTYTITPSGLTSANYELSFVSANLTVNPKQITNLALDITGNYTYNGLEQTPTYTLKNNAISLTNNTDYTAQLRNNKDAGTATLTLTGKGNYTGSIEKTFTIAKASLTITANAETITYGDSAPTYTAIYDGFVPGETVTALTGSITGTYTIGSGISSTSNVYTITPKFNSVNYSITQKTATLTVNARNITIALTAQSGYTGAIWEKSLSNSDVSNVISGHSFSGTLQTTSANVNTYTCNPTDLTLTNFKWKSDYDIKDNNSISVKNNYNITYNLKVIIERGAINFSITDGSSVYDGAWHNSSITVDSPNCAVGYSTDSAPEKVYVATAPTFKNAGTHTVYYRVYGTTPGQYNESIGEITLKITPKALTVKANALTITYGDLAPTYTASFNGFVNNETLAVLGGNLTFACAYNINDSANNGAKTYTITPSDLTSANYDLSFVGSNLTVNPKQINNLALDITGHYTYNGTAQTPTYTLKNNAILLAINTDFTAQLSNNKNAGTATLKLAGKGNYSGSIEKTFTIATATLTVTANTPTAITYGDPAPTTYTASFSGFVNGENENKPNILGGSLAITCAYNVNDSANNGAKTYEITPSGLTSANYTLNFVNGELVVNPQAITKETFTLTLTPTISKPIGASAFAKNLALATQNINSGEYIYTGLAQIPTYKLTKNDINKTELVGGADFNFNISDNINVGSAQITIEGKGNYIGTIIDQIIIKAAELSITANAETITFGDSAPNYTASFSGFVNNETLAVLGGNLTFACDYNVSTNNNAKAYTITLSGFTSTNYKLSFVSANLTVNPKQITNLALDITGNYTYNGTAQTPTYTLKNNAILLTNNTDFTAQLRNNKDAGTATLTLTGTGNYGGSIEKTFTIAKAPLTVTANTPTAITYGDSAPTYTAIYDGFVNGETVTALTGSITGNYTIGSGISSISNVYTITPSFTSANYSITQKTATLTVNKKDLTINADNLSVVYNSDIPQYTLTFVGLYEGDKNTFNVPLSCAYKKDSNVGSYAITVGDISNNNYNITKTNGALTVTSKAVAVVWGNTAFSYNATVQTVNAHFVDVYGANVAVIVAITNTSGNAEFKNAGEYTASATTTNANYTLTNTNTQCTMAKGTYTSEQIPVVQTFNITYNPKASLNDITLPIGTEITLPSGFSWNASGTIPTPNVKQYAATYNADSANYNNATVMLNVEVAKATATINADTIQSFNYNGTPHSAVATLTYGGTPVSTTAATLLYSNGNPFTAANTYKTTISIKSVLYQADDVTVFVKICAVSVNGTYYTIEDAINNATSGTIVVKFDTTFADTEIANVCYPNASYYTIKAGVQLLVPYDEAATTEMEKVATVFISESGTLGSPFKTLTVPAGINLVCNGTINVNAKRSHHSTIYMGHTAGDYGVLNLETGATLTLESGSTLNSSGYIIGGGSIEAKSGATVFDVLAIKDFRGGQATSKIKGTLFPFNQYSFNNIEATIIVNAGAIYNARYGLYASSTPFTGVMEIIGKGAIFELDTSINNPSSITKSFDSTTGKIKISLTKGSMKTNSASISIANVPLDTTAMEFPIPGNFEFKIESGSIFDVYNRFRFLPGAKLTVDSGATLNIKNDGKVYFYGDAANNAFQSKWSNTEYSGTQASVNSRVPYKYTHTDPATFIVNGTVNVAGASGGLSAGVLAGVIQTTGSGATLNLASATLTGTTIECNGEPIKFLSKISKVTIEVTFTAKGDTGAGNVDLVPGTYKSDKNGKWIKQ